MKLFRFIAVPVLAVMCLAGANTRAAAQISINIGVAPVCPYGYFNYAPYQCAPFGYYGPQWFTGGVFLGAGPWYRGPAGFHGYINTYYDPHYGYHGPYPVRGERADWGRHAGWDKHWHGNEEYHHDNGNHYGEYKEHNGHGNDHHDDHGKGHDDRGHGHDDHGHGGKGHNK
jgi:hypothetical protein